MKKLNFYKRPIMIDYVRINNTEVKVLDLLSTVSDLEETEVGDSYGDCSLRDYEVNTKIADLLVEMGLVRTYTGPRMAKLYCKVDETSLEELRDQIYDYLEENEQRN